MPGDSQLPFSGIIAVSPSESVAPSGTQDSGPAEHKATKQEAKVLLTGHWVHQ